MRVTTAHGIERQLMEGRLSQRCPVCGRVEAAGFYCTASCGPGKTWTPTDERHWYVQKKESKH